MILSKLKYLAPVVYIIGAAFVWRDFARLPPDGLANLGLVLYTLPVVLVAMAAGRNDFPYLHAGEYYQRNASYFAVSVALLAAVCFLILFGMEKWWKKRRMKKETG